MEDLPGAGEAPSSRGPGPGREAARRYNAYRKALRRVVFVTGAAGALAVSALVLAGVFLSEPGSGYFETDRLDATWWAFVAMLAAVVVETALLLRSARCPFCGGRIRPWHYPRMGVSCPRCGATTDDE